MKETVSAAGMVLKAAPSGEYDKRLVILTRELGKITAFARGARRPGNSLMAAGRSFVFGTFRLFQGRDAYTLSSAEITNYFDESRLLWILLFGNCRLLFQGKYGCHRYAEAVVPVPQGAVKTGDSQSFGAEDLRAESHGNQRGIYGKSHQKCVRFHQVYLAVRSGFSH